MAFEAKNFIICSRFPLFRASGNLWLYQTMDALDDILSAVDSDGYSTYFRPRENLKNHDSPNKDDIILMFVEDAKLVYLRIVDKKEKPYMIKVARTYLENEATLLALITELQLDKAAKATDFVTPIADENLGITQTEQTELEEKIDLAANSGRMITEQGFWYAKMHSETVAPSAENGTNYADFSQTDGQGNPIIVTYNRVNGSWVQDQTITPPADYDGYVPITSKIWDIDEQDGQQGGRILWNHTSKQFTPYPNIVSFDSIEITGDSTVEMPLVPTDDNIANVGFVKNTIGGARNIGDIFLTQRTDTALNGAVECDGATYDITDFDGATSIGFLLALNKVPYVSLSAYASEITAKGWCDKFGWDGVNTTQFRVPTLNAYIWQKITAGIKGSIGKSSATARGEYFVAQSTSFTQETLPAVGGYTISVTNDQTIPGASVDTTDTVSDLRVMVQLAIGATDQALETCTSVLAMIANADFVIERQEPTAANNYTWYRKYKSGWVEQGGQTSDATDGTIAITLPVELADANYIPLITGTYIANTGSATNNGASKAAGAFSDRTTTGFNLWKQPVVPYGWEIRYMAAQ